MVKARRDLKGDLRKCRKELNGLWKKLEEMSTIGRGKKSGKIVTAENFKNASMADVEKLEAGVRSVKLGTEKSTKK